MNKMMKMTVIAIGSALLCSQAMAQSAMQQLKFQAGSDAVVASQRIETPRASIVSYGQPLTIPRDAKDVFAQCQTIDAKAFSLVSWTLPQAVQAMQFCLNKNYNKTSAYSVTATASNGAAAGIQIMVAGRILTGDSVLMDLAYSLRKRADKVMGWSASLDSQAVILR
jgi:hypothetical protein